ncbi:MAG TPA: hypothetical protein VK633_05420 [Verrucomicrobiae bacterium]|nr:hypothetical protein [Verrucomicrobiae bacterium]
MKFVRKLHLYLSVFFAPLLIFYIGTGWYQTVQSQRNKLLGEQETFAAKLTSIHVDQVYPKPNVLGEYSPALFKALVVTMSISLLVTIALGIYLAFRTSRRLWTVGLSLVLGLLLPALFLWLGQPK